MGGSGILFAGVLATIAALVIAAVIVALAPYVAAGIVVVVVCWWVLRNQPADPTAGEELSPSPPLPRQQRHPQQVIIDHDQIRPRE